jgi:hypothetical protein
VKTNVKQLPCIVVSCPRELISLARKVVCVFAGEILLLFAKDNNKYNEVYLRGGTLKTHQKLSMLDYEHGSSCV